PRDAAAGDPNALAEVARYILYIENDYPRGLAALQKASDAGDRPSTDRLYHELLSREHGLQDFSRAAKLLPLLAEWGDAEAMDLYGSALIAGDGFPQDAVRGLAFREKAAKGEDSAIMFRLACDYEIGIGIPADLARATHWYSQAFWHQQGLHKTPALGAKLGLLLLAQKDGLRVNRNEFAKLISPTPMDVLYSVLTPATRAALTARIAAELAPDQPAPANPATVIGLMWTDARLGPPDYAQATQLFLNNTDAAALRQRGLMHENGWWCQRDADYRWHFLPADHAEALKCFADAAARDDGPAHYYLAQAALEKWHATSALSAADDSERHAREGARLGDPASKSFYAQWIQYRTSESQALTAEEKTAAYIDARRLWAEADAAGIIAATYYLGVSAENGDGTPTDLPAAIGLIRRAAEGGYASAQEHLGLWLDEGREGLPRDRVAGRALLVQAAAEIPRAANEFAVSLWHSDEVKTRSEEIKTWLEKSFDGGYWVAGRNLAKFWHVGLGGVKDETLARTTLEKAAAQGGKEGAKVPAAAFTKGDAVDPDPIAAAKWQALAEG
ncbi:MAG: sel1 repeat family protein, partial [Undibacterium sp.]|nr:sel1 repeat family protein [Opitutaceae bacterium]